jgi:hypothetical protein
MSAATFSVTTIDLSTNAPQLAPLSGREYNSEYTSLPNANLPKALRKDLDTVFQFMAGEELPLDENTFLIKSRDGVYFRLFGPVLKAGADGIEGTSDGRLYIQWGPRYLPINIVKGGFTLPNGTEMEAEFGSYNFSGRGEDPALFVSVDTEDGQLVLPVAVRFADWENPLESKALNALLKKKPEDVVALIQKVTAKGTGGGSGQRVEVDSEVDFRDLPVNEPFEVINYYSCKTSYGLTYRIAINNYPEEGQVAGAWAHSSIRPLLATKPEINREKPAVLTIRSKEELDNNKIRIRSTLLLAAQEADEEALNLDF